MMRDDSDAILSDLLSITRRGGKTFYIYTHARPDGSIFYVGKGVGDRARDFFQRSEHHKRIVRKHGPENIRIMVYPVVDERHAYGAERMLILAMKKAGLRLANCDDGGASRMGVSLTAEHRAKLSQSLTGHPVSEEVRAKISAASRGRKLSEAAKEKLRARKLSDEHKAALLAAITGRVVSEESKAKARAKMVGRKLTPEHIEKMAASKRGVKQSPETVAKRALGIKAAWAARRANA